jgi:hypothetical protein
MQQTREQSWKAPRAQDDANRGNMSSARASYLAADPL